MQAVALGRCVGGVVLVCMFGCHTAVVNVYYVCDIKDVE